MRDETRRKLERQLWLDRLKWIGAGLGLAALAGVGLWVTGLDATVETHHVPGVVATVGPLVGTTTKAIEEGLAERVPLAGRVRYHLRLVPRLRHWLTRHPDLYMKVRGLYRKLRAKVQRPALA